MKICWILLQSTNTKTLQRHSNKKMIEWKFSRQFAPAKLITEIKNKNSYTQLNQKVHSTIVSIKLIQLVDVVLGFKLIIASITTSQTLEFGENLIFD